MPRSAIASLTAAILLGANLRAGTAGYYGPSAVTRTNGPTGNKATAKKRNKAWACGR